MHRASLRKQEDSNDFGAGSQNEVNREHTQLQNSERAGQGYGWMNKSKIPVFDLLYNESLMHGLASGVSQDDCGFKKQLEDLILQSCFIIFYVTHQLTFH